MSARPHLSAEPAPELEAVPVREGGRAVRSEVVRVGLGGFLFGALLYGAPIALIHVIYNRVGSVRDAVVAYGAFLLMYGLWTAAAFVLGWIGVAGLGRRSRRAVADSGGLPRGALAGMLLFHLVFWEVFWLYGLTYDQAPFGPPAGAGGMVALLIGLGVGIAVVVVVASWALWRVGEALRRGGWLGRLAAAGFLAGLVAVGAKAVAMGEPAVAPQPPLASALAPAETGVKVVLVGLDGADWRVARPMMARGELPTFSRLARQGVAVDLATIHDSNSAVIWASMYTGARPEVHGVLDFYRIHLPGMASAGLFPVHRSFFKELADLLAKVGLASRTTVDRSSLSLPPVWEIADRAGLSIGLVDGYFYSFPALKPQAPESFFLSYGLDAFAPGKPARHIELFAQPRDLFRRVRPLLDRGDFGWQSAALLDLLGDPARGAQPRFVNLYTHEPDSSQHWYWKWHEPRYYLGVGREELEANGERIRDLYRQFDGFLGRLLGAVEPGTVVVVASDHGHSPTIVHEFYTQHRHGPPGILLMAGGPVVPGKALANVDVYDLHPTLLYLLGLPVPADAAGRVLTEALDPAWVRRHPLRTVPSYRGLPPSPGLPFVAGDAERNRQEIEKLKALGYI